MMQNKFFNVGNYEWVVHKIHHNMLLKFAFVIENSVLLIVIIVIIGIAVEFLMFVFLILIFDDEKTVEVFNKKC